MLEKIKNIYLKYKEVINYLIFGVFTTIVSLASYYILTYSLLDANNEFELQIANVISWVISVIFAYITNRKYVFKSSNENIFKEITSFVGSRLITLFMDMLIMYVGVSVLGQDAKIFKLISQVIVIIGNYLFSKIFVFKKSIKEKNI